MTHLQIVPAALGELKHTRLRAGIVTPLFQPIVAMGSGGKRQIVAVEALSRGPHGTPYESPIALFAAAHRSGVVTQLDRLCIETALDAARRLPRHLTLFLNVHPATLCADCGFPAFLSDAAARNGIEPSRISLELLEHARVGESQCRQLITAIKVLRGIGVQFAVDDVTDMDDDIDQALALCPDYLKVDAAVVRGARTDRTARTRLRDIAAQATRCGARVVAEGIEDARDQSAVEDAGIGLAQGYLFGRPVVADIVNRLTQNQGDCRADRIAL